MLTEMMHHHFPFSRGRSQQKNKAIKRNQQLKPTDRFIERFVMDVMGLNYLG